MDKQPQASNPGNDATSDTQLPPSPYAPAAASPIPASPSNGKKVLCVEDEHFISELYERALTKAGYQVTTIVDGQQGLKEAQTNKYDIILLDLMVPNMTGIEVLRHLRDPKQTPKLDSKVIITTNLEQREEIRADIESQADGYLVKAEITPRELVEILDKLN